MLEPATKMKPMNIIASSYQRGIATFTILVFTVLVTISAMLAYKIVPSYLEFEVISSGLDKVTKLENINRIRSTQIIEELESAVRQHPSYRRSELNIPNISYVAARDGLKVIGVNYEVVIPLAYNFSALLDFKKEVTIDPYAQAEN